jgi:hypothetical protein
MDVITGYMLGNIRKGFFAMAGVSGLSCTIASGEYGNDLCDTPHRLLLTQSYSRKSAGFCLRIHQRRMRTLARIMIAMIPITAARVITGT